MHASHHRATFLYHHHLLIDPALLLGITHRSTLVQRASVTDMVSTTTGAPASDMATESIKAPIDIDQELATLVQEPATHQTTADAAPSTAAPAEANGTSRKEDEPTDPAEWRARMWFVKMPRPQEDSTLLALEQEHDSLKAQMNLLTESLKIKRVGSECVHSSLCTHSHAGGEGLDRNRPPWRRCRLEKVQGGHCRTRPAICTHQGTAPAA